MIRSRFSYACLLVHWVFQLGNRSRTIICAAWRPCMHSCVTFHGANSGHGRIKVIGLPMSNCLRATVLGMSMRVVPLDGIGTISRMTR